MKGIVFLSSENEAIENIKSNRTSKKSPTFSIKHENDQTPLWKKSGRIAKISNCSNFLFRKSYKISLKYDVATLRPNKCVKSGLQQTTFEKCVDNPNQTQRDHRRPFQDFLPVFHKTHRNPGLMDHKDFD